MDNNFWKNKPLSDFTEEEWEAVCMRCGKCCLFKQEENNHICFTNQMCDGYDFKTGCCSRYATRLCMFCVKVDMHLLQTEPELLPETCAYRLLLAGKELPDSHPLVSGNPNSAHEAKQTVLEIPNIHSVTEIDDLLHQFDETLKDENCPAEKRMGLLDKIQKLKPVHIAKYPIP